MRYALLTMVLALASCVPTQTSGVDKIEVSISKKVMKAGGKVIPVETSRYGLGTRPGSGCTPLGTYVVNPEYGHRFGPVLRPEGRQGSRGILIHRDLSRGWGTNGCIAVPDYATAKWLVSNTKPGTELVIHR